MHSAAVKSLWLLRPGYRKRAQQDIRLVQQYSLLLAVLLTSVVYRLLAVVIVQFLYLMLSCESSFSNGYVITVCAENATFVCAYLWAAGAATDNWLAGAVNRTASQLLQAVSFGCLCANITHFFVTVFGSRPSCWPPHFTGLLWGVTWLNLASFIFVAVLLVEISSPMNLFEAVRQADSVEPQPAMGRE